MVRHKAVRVDLDRPGLDQRGQDLQEGLSIFIVQEDRHPCDTSGHHMVEGAVELDPRCSAHAEEDARTPAPCQKLKTKEWDEKASPRGVSWLIPRE